MPRAPRTGREVRLRQVMEAVVHHGATTRTEIARHLGLKGVGNLVHSCVTRKWLEEAEPTYAGGTTWPHLAYRATDKGRDVVSLRTVPLAQEAV